MKKTKFKIHFHCKNQVFTSDCFILNPGCQKLANLKHLSFSIPVDIKQIPFLIFKIKFFIMM